MLEITYSKQAVKSLRTMQPKAAQRILSAIEKLAADPASTELDIKALQGRDGYRLRVGDWRILYSQDGVILAIEKIAPRGKAYR
jgi:mRNA interferase RelE/StbE